MDSILKNFIDELFLEMKECAKENGIEVPDDAILEYVTKTATLTYEFGLRYKLKL